MSKAREENLENVTKLINDIKDQDTLSILSLYHFLQQKKSELENGKNLSESDKQTFRDWKNRLFSLYSTIDDNRNVLKKLSEEV